VLLVIVLHLRQYLLELCIRLASRRGAVRANGVAAALSVLLPFDPHATVFDVPSADEGFLADRTGEAAIAPAGTVCSHGY
jgi:hypothetical protein